MEMPAKKNENRPCPKEKEAAEKKQKAEKTSGSVWKPLVFSVKKKGVDLFEWFCRNCVKKSKSL